MSEDTEVQEEEKDITGGLIKVTMTEEEEREVMLGPVEDYSNLDSTPKDVLKRIRRKMNALKHGFTALVPLTCVGDECPMSNWCPLADEDLVANVVGKLCPVETDVMLYKKLNYIEEYEVDTKDGTMMSIINRLVELDIQDARASVALSRQGGQDLLLEKEITNDRGTTIKEKVMHPAFLAKEKIQRLRLELLRDIVGTPREKYRRDAALKQRSDRNIADKASKLRNKIIDAEIVSSDFVNEKGTN